MKNRPWIIEDSKKSTSLIGSLEGGQNKNYFIMKYLVIIIDLIYYQKNVFLMMKKC
jgi:hypothetical protein